MTFGSVILILLLLFFAALWIMKLKDDTDHKNELEQTSDLIQRHIDNEDYLWLLENCGAGLRHDHAVDEMTVVGERIYNFDANEKQKSKPIKYNVENFKSINFDALEFLKRLTNVPYEKRLRLAQIHDLVYPLHAQSGEYYIFGKNGTLQTLDVEVESKSEVAMKYCFYRALDTMIMQDQKNCKKYKARVIEALEDQILRTYDSQDEFEEHARFAGKTLATIYETDERCFDYSSAYKDICYRRKIKQNSETQKQSIQ